MSLTLRPIILHQLAPYGGFIIAAVGLILLCDGLRVYQDRSFAQNASSSGSMTQGSNVQSQSNGPLSASGSPVAEGNLLVGDAVTDARVQATTDGQAAAELLTPSIATSGTGTAYGEPLYGPSVWPPPDSIISAPSIITGLTSSAVAANLERPGTYVGNKESGLSAAGEKNFADRDQELRRQMRAVTSWLQNYCVTNHRFPPFGDQMSWSEGQLNMLVADNPYSASAVQTPVMYVSPGVPASPETATPSANYEQSGRVRLAIDTDLTGRAVSQYSNQPPDEWVADPGTIVAVGNETGIFMVWGAGIDGLPIRDPLTGQVVIDVANWGYIH